MRRILLLFISTALIFGSCKPKEDEKTLEESARDELYELMASWYLWNDKMPEINVGEYANPYELLEAVRYTQYDRWSFVADYDEFMAEMSGSFVGHGFRAALDPDNNVRVITVYSGSDMYAKGVRRGWIIKQINGTDLAPIFIANDYEAYSALLGDASAGVTNTFLFGKPDGTEMTLTTAKASFTVNTVLDYDTLHLSTGITGYLAFDAFLSVSSSELESAFSFFETWNVNNIIVDLRYNGGGYLDVAQLLSSYIIGNAYTSQTWIKMCYNSTIATAENQTFGFTTTSHPLYLTNAVFITTDNTASASEVVISSLKPYIDVKLVGSTTHGKPTGMDLFQYQYKFVFAPVTFEYKNSQDYGAFYDGIPVDVEAADDYTRDFGDRKESSIAAAIALIEGTASSKSAVDKSFIPVMFDEKSGSHSDFFINNLSKPGK